MSNQESQQGQLVIPSVATQVNLQVRWSDQDIFHHVNNARLVTLFEEARVRSYQSWQADGDADWPKPGETVGQVVRSMSLDFYAPVLAGYGANGEVQASVWVSRIGNTSFTLQEMIVQNGRPCAHQEAHMVAVDLKTGRPVALPDDLRAQLEQVLAE